MRKPGDLPGFFVSQFRIGKPIGKLQKWCGKPLILQQFAKTLSFAAL
jgi:hypothetical protein